MKDDPAAAPEGDASDAVPPGGPFSVLAEEHRRLRALIRRAREAGEGHQLEAAEALLEALRGHMEREDALLYDAVEALLGGREGAVAVMREDHRAIDDEVTALERAMRTPLRNLGEILADLERRLDQHIQREEHVLFPFSDALLSDAEKAALLNRLRADTGE